MCHPHLTAMQYVSPALSSPARVVLALHPVPRAWGEPESRAVTPPNGKSRHFFFQAEDGIRDHCVTGVQTCALPISGGSGGSSPSGSGCLAAVISPGRWARRSAGDSPSSGSRRAICPARRGSPAGLNGDGRFRMEARSEEHTSELQSHSDLVCRLLLE